MTKSKSSRKRNGVASKAIQAAVNRAITAKVERKQFIYSQGSTVSSATGTTYPLSQGIVQGIQLNQRIGNKVILREIHLKATVNLPSAAIVGTLRCVLYADKLNVGVQPGTTDVLQSSTVVAPISLTSQINKRFNVFYDQSIPLVTGGGDQNVVIDKTVKTMLPVDYFGTTNANGSNGRNAIFILFVTDLAATQPVYAFDALLSYNDP